MVGTSLCDPPGSISFKALEIAFSTSQVVRCARTAGNAKASKVAMLESFMVVRNINRTPKLCLDPVGDDLMLEEGVNVRWERYEGTELQDHRAR